MVALVAQIESLSDALEEWQAMLPEHWAEVAPFQAQVPLDPNFDAYLRLEMAGMLVFAGLREAGRLVGYYTGYVAPSLQYQSRQFCMHDHIYVHPGARARMGGRRLLRCVEHELQRRGVTLWYASEIDGTGAGRLYEAMGFHRSEVSYAKLLGVH